MTHFAFLRAEWPDLHDAAAKAEELARADARAACFYARRALELAVAWMYVHDVTLKRPYQDHLSALIHEATFREAVGAQVFAKAKLLKELGNQAVHSTKPVREVDAFVAVRELFHVCFWLARTYARGAKPVESLVFEPNRLSRAAASAPQTLVQLQQLAAQVREKDEHATKLARENSALDDELKRLRAEVAQAKSANAARPDAHDYSEAETRDYFIDLLLKEAGWALDQARDREFEVSGMPNNQGVGFVDYVLWGDDGLPLALVEAKRTKRDARVGQQQAKLYADCLEQQFGRRPIVFYSNGYEHWLWDDALYPPRAMQGFLTKAELELALQRRATRTSLASSTIDNAIVGRHYQHRAIRRIGEAFEKNKDRKALVVMATGAGKTRTVIALCDVLMRCNWAKRVLFLADRVALVKQAANAFKKHLPNVPVVNLALEDYGEQRVCVATYPTMLGLIDEMRDGQRAFGVGHFDLIVIDEAHRSVYRKYRAIFEYFDALLVGLTATPKDEIDRNTYGLFDLETGVPTDVYALEDAVREGYLVPPRAVSVPLKFQREGISYDELSDDEKEQWDALEWSEDGEVPDHVDAAAVNRWLFNRDTVDKVLEYLMTRGLKVAGGDRLGKTIVFAKNHEHAQFIAERFDANYPHSRGEFARVIDFKVDYVHKLIDDFEKPDAPPHIAISVDMLDTGVDIPEVVNLVFFKLVRSKTKFWQMLGRGTRLRPDLFGPGQDKQCFYVFDFCQNLEFFAANPETTEGAAGEALGTRLFKTRVELLGVLDEHYPVGACDPLPSGSVLDALAELRRDNSACLHAQVAAMNVNNFIVRARRRVVERFANAQAWTVLTTEDRETLTRQVATLPSELVDDDETAKRFDVLMLRLQIAVLRKQRTFERLAAQVREIAALLENHGSIPTIRAEMALIEELQTDTFWQDVTAPMLENARRKLRGLVGLIDKSERRIVYTDFADELGPDALVDFEELHRPDEFEQFRTKARHFLREHSSHPVIHKLRTNEPLHANDLAELGSVFVQSGTGSAADVARATQEAQGFGLFVRSLIGLDREAAVRAFAQFLTDRCTSANQHHFTELVIEHVVEHGWLDADALYASPFTEVSPRGPEALFPAPAVEEMLALLAEVRRRAA